MGQFSHGAVIGLARSPLPLSGETAQGRQAALQQDLIDHVTGFRIEVEHIGDVLNSDGVEAIVWFCKSGSEGLQVGDLPAVGLGDDKITDLVVTDRSGGPDHAA